MRLNDDFVCSRLQVVWPCVHLATGGPREPPNALVNKLSDA